MNTLTPIQRENLKRLAYYLLEGKLKAEFDMRKLTQEAFVDIGDARITCRTVGCALGHAPYAGIKKEKLEDWFDYSERVFGVPCLTRTFDYIFSGEWEPIDNTALGAGRRLIRFLSSGVPEGFTQPSEEFKL